MATPLPAISFDIGPNDAAYRRALAPVYWSLWLAGPVISAIGVWFFIIAPSPIRWLALALFGIAAYSLWGANGTRKSSATRVEIGADGVTVNRPRAPAKLLAFVSPKGRFALVDFSQSGDSRRVAPWAINTRTDSVGISAECAAAVILAAERGGLKDEVSDGGVAGMAPRVHRFRR